MLIHGDLLSLSLSVSMVLMIRQKLFKLIIQHRGGHTFVTSEMIN